MKEPGWKRKDCGYAAVFKYRGWEIHSCAFDMLEVYRWILDDMHNWTDGDFVPETITTTDVTIDMTGGRDEE